MADSTVTINGKDLPALLVNSIVGNGDLTLDAWGTPKYSKNHSLFHGVFTYDVPSQMWLSKVNDVEENLATSVNCTTYEGMLKVVSTGS